MTDALKAKLTTTNFDGRFQKGHKAKVKTHCLRGHPRTPENTLGHRECRICAIASKRYCYERKAWQNLKYQTVKLGGGDILKQSISEAELSIVGLRDLRDPMYIVEGPHGQRVVEYWRDVVAQNA